MFIDEETDTLQFVSGKKMYANFGCVGIRPDMSVSYGSDGGLLWGPDDDEMSVIERLELADCMIKLWTEFKDAIK